LARKHFDQLSPRYRARIERAQARGLTRQQARGHRPGEAARRREYQREHNAGLTSAQLRQIERFASRPDYTPAKTVSGTTLADFAREHGYEAFSRYRKAWEKAHRGRQRDGYRKGIRNPAAGDLYDFMAEYDHELPDEAFFYG